MESILKRKSDEVGMLTSTLCILHCLATPFLLVAIPGAALAQEGSLVWWRSLDILFLAIAFFAVYRSVQQSNVRWLQSSMIVSWVLLSFFIINERFEGIEFPFDMVYFPAFALVVLHLVNRRHCRCDTDCCEQEESTKDMA